MPRPVTEVTIIGAGPYGLSIAAHLRASEVPFRIFGKPMSVWQDQMPGRTLLKSFGFASNLYDPASTFTLAHFCQERGLPYSDVIAPVPIETFVAYGLEFQRRFVGELEQTNVIGLQQSPEGFAVTTESGELFLSRRVILATGISHFGYVPPVFADLPVELATHSSSHTSVSRFRGQTVAVIGAGASAVDVAGLLHEEGAEVHLIVRRDSIHFYGAPGTEPRPLTKRLLKPRSGLGEGWRARLSADLPLLFHALPQRLRLYAVRTVNGPASTWLAKNKVVGRVNIHLGTSVRAAQRKDNAVRLELSLRDGTGNELQVDHVIYATGYEVKLPRLKFLDPNLLSRMKTFGGAPILDTNFESSVPGLYLVGLASAVSFGPLCRFAYGAKFTSKRLARHLGSHAAGR